MTARTLATREELHAALIASRVRLGLDEALANPPIARLLELYVEASKSSGQLRPCTPPSYTPDRWAARLRRLVGNMDHQQLRAGDIE